MVKPREYLSAHVGGLTFCTLPVSSWFLSLLFQFRCTQASVDAGLVRWESGEKIECRVVSRPGRWAERRVDLKQAGVELGWGGLARGFFFFVCRALNVASPLRKSFNCNRLGRRSIGLFVSVVARVLAAKRCCWWRGEVNGRGVVVVVELQRMALWLLQGWLG